jgi:hypothetical protein
MSSVSVLQIVIALWSAVTIIYLALFLYRSIVGMREEDTLFLSAGESRMAAEQVEVMKRINKVDSITRKFGFATLFMTIVLGGVWVYGAVTQLL